ncbi:methyltransferase domain-containing protein [Thauera sp. CAU 1555]|uniref:Methyltransferase domain-containing protein n=1 Tax=Thauera sedimentorum TaxID=2767595 RepID=A0ABR9B7V5_9RHOO|nr:methyltransferase domain-containing protein [Thauera sedimentorum]MBC9071515.1 methyltransferase domain-containing protein [Thauera sedimentorum]MBD8502434.1 methyltransferase domain-containing protein [Thauera sedimentorum]
MSILSLSDWLDTPQGRYLLGWEQEGFDRLVADLFGYNAVQIGLPEVDFLRANRMPFRFHADRLGEAAVITRSEALPFASASLDLVILPHVLEFSSTPHQVLREVERVLMPEGNVIISGFNPFSLWGLRRLAARRRGAFPWRGQYLSPFRIKDWLTLLGFETQSAGFGCYAPAVRSEQWLARWHFLDRAGPRWWPICGAVYLMHGVKRVQGMRLITPNWREKRAAAKRMAPIAQRGRSVTGTRKTQ